MNGDPLYSRLYAVSFQVEALSWLVENCRPSAVPTDGDVAFGLGLLFERLAEEVRVIAEALEENESQNVEP